MAGAHRWYLGLRCLPRHSVVASLKTTTATGVSTDVADSVCLTIEVLSTRSVDAISHMRPGELQTKLTSQMMLIPTVRSTIDKLHAYIKRGPPDDTTTTSPSVAIFDATCILLVWSIVIYTQLEVLCFRGACTPVFQCL